MRSLSRGRLRSMAMGMAAMLSLPILHCIGTTSETESDGHTTIVGAASLPDGRPASGAEVYVRSTEISFSPEGIPRAKAMDSAMTDGLGRFRLTFPGSGRFFLEMREASADTSGTGPYPAVFLKEYRSTPSETLSLGTLL